MPSKPTILLLLGSFLPGFRAGGPVPSVANLVARLNDEFDFRILTSDRDLGDGKPYPDLPADHWITAYGAQVRYCSPAMLTGRAIAATLRDTPHDLLYLNSFFAARFTIAPLVARRLGQVARVPCVLAPRGEFSGGALALKARRKRAYIGAGRVAGLFRGLLWQASTEHEAADIRAALGGADRHIRVASDLAAPLPDAPPPHTPRARGDPLRVIFVSRISPMKNLDFALSALAGVDVPVDFTIIGPEEDAAYAARCHVLAQHLPAHVRVCFAGAMPPGAIPARMAAHDLFFLPTRGENFGHVIAEALGAGTPVLLSDTTPWRGLEGLGHALPLDRPDLFRRALTEAWHQPQTDAAQMRARAATHARARQHSRADVEANRALFRAALENTSATSQTR